MRNGRKRGGMCRKGGGGRLDRPPRSWRWQKEVGVAMRYGDYRPFASEDTFPLLMIRGLTYGMGRGRKERMKGILKGLLDPRDKRGSDKCDVCGGRRMGRRWDRQSSR